MVFMMVSMMVLMLGGPGRSGTVSLAASKVPKSAPKPKDFSKPIGKRNGF